MVENELPQNQGNPKKKSPIDFIIDDIRTNPVGGGEVQYVFPGEKGMFEIYALIEILKERFCDDPIATETLSRMKTVVGDTLEKVKKSSEFEVLLRTNRSFQVAPKVEVEDRYSHLEFDSFKSPSQLTLGMMVQFVDRSTGIKVLSWEWREVTPGFIELIEKMPRGDYMWIRLVA